MNFCALSRYLLPRYNPHRGVPGLLGAGVAALTLAATALAGPVATAAPPTPRAAAVTAAAAPAQSALIGFNGARLSDSDAQLGADLDAIRNAGAAWVRVGVDWSQIEPNPGSSDFSAADRVVNAARSRGLAVLAITTYTPRWAQDASVAPGTSHGRPSSPGVFADFAGRAAQHFAGRVSTWEIWNEPNNPQFFLPNTDATFYAQMVTAAARVIHTTQPGSTVIAGAMSPAGGSDQPAVFLQQMYASGVGPSMDAVSTHPYSYPALPSETQDWNAFYQLAAEHDVMVRNGDGAKKIWLTEFGAPTGVGNSMVTEDRQSAIVADGLSSARARPYVGPVFLYELRDQQTGSSDRENDFGLLHTDGSPKSAYAAVQRQAATDTPPAPTPAPVNGVHGAIAEHYYNTPGLAALFGPTTTPELTTPDTVGRYNHFDGGDGGSIYWTPNTGAWSVHGAIRGHWESLSWERGPTGYPLTDENTTPDGVGRYNHFTGGDGASIYWTPNTGAQLVHGAIRDRWAAMGWERSSLGYPVSDEYAVPGGRRSNFQHGSLTYRFSDGAILIG